MASCFPLANIHISTHPCVKAKLSQLRSHSTNARETKALVHEIALIIGSEALASCLTTVETGIVSLLVIAHFHGPNTPPNTAPNRNALPACLLNPALTPSILYSQAETPLGYAYPTTTTTPTVALVPILRSGLGMLDALQLLLPDAVSVHHLGLFREATTLSPVEYVSPTSSLRKAHTNTKACPSPQ